MTQSTITLTPEQEQAKDRLLAFINSDERAIILQGHAGTGKTTIIKEVERYRKAYEQMMEVISVDTPKYKWTYTAMTHKAREALEAALEHKASTLHSFLGLRPKLSGRLYKTGSIPRGKHVVLIIDECSYMNYQILEYLNEFLSKNPTCKVILLGDKNQLPPVGLNHCPAYHSDLEEIVLTKSVRQKDSPFIDEAASMFRNMVMGTGLQSIRTDSTQVILLPKKEWEKQMITSFEENHNVKVVRQSNHQVNQTNSKLFKHFYNRQEYKEGDVVICNNFHRGIYSDTQMIIKRIGTTLHMGIEAYVIFVITEENSHQTLMIPKKRSDLNKELERLRAEKNYQEAHMLVREFADIRPMYACTVHKSQGSTYNEVFINLTDFKRMYSSDPRMTARLLYVAFSRAKYRVYLTGDIV